MSETAIIERIISDAREEAEEIIKEAENKAAETVAEANARAERNRLGTQAEIEERVNGIFDGKAASARLDGAKIMLGEKRGVIDEIYARALEKLIALDKTDALDLAQRLLTAFAEEGDEIVFAENYRFSQEVSLLPAVRKMNLTVAPKQGKFDGGFILCGKNSDKNLSYGALLSADREQNQALLASRIFTE